MWKSGRMIAGVLGVLVGGCALRTSPSPPPSTPGPRGSVSGMVRVFVTEDLRGAWDQAAASLGRALPQVTLKVESGPWPALRQRILQGDRPDLLVSLGPEDLIPLVQKNLIADGGALARVRLTVAESRSRPLGLEACPDLGKPLVQKIAVAPAKDSALGTATQTTLKKALMSKTVQAKLREVAPEKLLPAVANGAAQVAIVPLHWLRPGQPGASQVQRGVDVPDELGGDFRVSVSLLAGASHSAAARAVLDHLLTPESKKAFVDWDCAPLGEDVPNRARRSLLVYCGAGLRRPMDEIGKRFKGETGVEVRYNYTGSPCLLAQIILYKKGDLYMPGEEYYMDQAVKRGFIAEHKVVAYFVPVIMVQKGNPRGVRKLTDLLKPGLKVGLGDPKSCALGSVTKKVLEKNGLWDRLERSRNLTFLASTAPELGNHIKFGTLDAAINWDAVASWYEDRADVVPIPAQQNVVSACPIGVLKLAKSQQPELARQFLEFVATEGQEIFRKHHYTVDPKEPSYPEVPVSAPAGQGRGLGFGEPTRYAHP
jgi:molybdate transport system substrate-binding protein